MAKANKTVKTVKTIQQKSIRGLAWASLVTATVGGTLATGTPIGDVLRTILGLVPWPWVPPVLLAAAILATAIDIVVDLEPNKAAVISVLLMPILASATHGKLGTTITGWAKDLLRWIDQPLMAWVGTDSAVGLAIACIIATFLMARRVVRKSKAAGLV
jgi:hypothetical protein